MPLINVSSIVNSPAFAQAFTINRSTNSPGFGLGGYTTTTVTIPMFGAVQKATSKEMQIVPEGDRVNETFKFISQQPIFTTNIGQGTSDICIWNGLQFRVVAVDEWEQNGYYRAFAQRMLGA